MQKILGQIRKLSNEFNLIEDGDRLCVGVSGGKDSLVLLTMLAKLRDYKITNFSLVAVSVDLSGGKMDFSKISEYCQQIDVPYHIVNSDIFEIVFDIRKEKNPCSLCAKMRRGLLNQAAKDMGCNKVCLGHHLDDLVETFVLSLVYEGRLYALSPKTYLSKTDLYAIRPLLYTSEEVIASRAKEWNLPVLHNPCKADKHTQRERAKTFLKESEKTYPNFRKNILSAITNPDRYSLWTEKNSKRK